MTYWALLPKTINDGVVLSAVPEGGPEDYEYYEGEPLLQGYPGRDKAIMVFDNIHYPDQSKLYDILPMLGSVIVANNKVKDVLDNLKIDTIEYLPIRLWGHQKEPVSDDYYILNPLGSVDFIDMKKSDYDMSALDEDQIKRIRKLVIDRDKIPQETKIFRATTKMDQLFIHDDLRFALEAADIQGYKLTEAEGWDGFDF